MKRWCTLTHQWESELYHEWVEFPDKCQCTPTEWMVDDKVPDICSKFEPNHAEPEICAKCCHEQACH